MKANKARNKFVCGWKSVLENSCMAPKASQYRNRVLLLKYYKLIKFPGNKPETSSYTQLQTNFTQKFQRLIHLGLFTNCFMNISVQSSDQTIVQIYHISFLIHLHALYTFIFGKKGV